MIWLSQIRYLAEYRTGTRYKKGRINQPDTGFKKGRINQPNIRPDGYSAVYLAI
jgi:hypothetical protein